MKMPAPPFILYFVDLTYVINRGWKKSTAGMGLAIRRIIISFIPSGLSWHEPFLCFTRQTHHLVLRELE
jgi:hypothetical protein